MNRRLIIMLWWGLLCGGLLSLSAQEPTTLDVAMDSIAAKETVNDQLLLSLKQQVTTLDSLRKVDSLQKINLEQQLANLKTSDEIKRLAIERQLGLLEENQSKYEKDKSARLDSLRQHAVGYPVVGLVKDTLFTLYIRVGSYGPAYRVKNIQERLHSLYEYGFGSEDTLTVTYDHDYADISYEDRILMTVTQNEAFWHDTTIQALAEEYSTALTEALHRANDEFSTSRLLKRLGLLVLYLIGTVALIRIINRVIRWLKLMVEVNRDKWLKDWRYKDYTIISKVQEVRLLEYVINFLRIVLIVAAIIVAVPIIFNLFPFSRDWSSKLSHTLLTPVRDLGMAVWNYLPNLFFIIVIYLVMRLLSKLAKYFFTEIELAKLRIPGFHPEFAKPTYTIIRILLIAFFLILIFPYLPGSGSPAFNGISVFVGVLVSFGSSSAIANMIAGIVITYMRPFRVGDRIKIEDVTGDVLEKNMLVTRLRTVTNEEITIPNSKILTAATINYSSLAESKGLILSTEVTFGFEIAWQEVEEAMLEAIGRCDRILKAPKPFVLQAGFNDNYVVYLVNGYTTEANAQAGIYSEIRGHIQDVCRERDLELLSPHYMATRDGTERTIPPDYKSQHPKDAEKAKRQEEAAEWHEKQEVKKAEKQREKELQAEEQKKLEKEGLQKEQEDKPTETSDDNNKDKK